MELQNYIILVYLLLPTWLILYYILPYFTLNKNLRGIPGPYVAKFSNVWLALGARKGKKFAWVHWAHGKYGTILRIGHNHVSIAEPEALKVVYAHGDASLLKDHFYEAFVSGVPGVFNVRDRAEHARKRKIIAHAFSPGAVHAFETHMADNLQRWVIQLDRISSQPTSPSGFAKINMMPWCTFLAFDIIGDLAFGAPFGMVEKGKDECEAQSVADGPVVLVRGAETLNRRGEVSSTLGLLLPLKPWAKYLPDPFFNKGLKAVESLHGIAQMAVSKRLDVGDKVIEGFKQRHDILEMLVRAKDASGNPMPREELVSEALTELIAGSDTVSNTACAIFYWIMHGERRAQGTIVSRLQAELDAAISIRSDIASHEQVRNLPFLRRCIDEAMRLHSTSAIGLPRIVTSPRGLQYEEHFFPQGTVLSVPSYTIHHSTDVWGPDVEEFIPDRWLPENITARQKLCFNPFSFGPRACVGQNVARMELALIIGTAFHRYEFELYQEQLESHEGFSKKPDENWMGIRRRVDSK